MMFVSGETGEPSVETTGMIEEIVHAQVVEMVSIQGIMLKAKRTMFSNMLRYS